MSILRRKGMTKAGFMLLRRPIVQMASSLISNTSSFSATNSACKFSAWARWASKRSSRDANTQYRISGSVGNREKKKIWLYYHSYYLYHHGSFQLLTVVLSHATIATRLIIKSWFLQHWVLTFSYLYYYYIKKQYSTNPHGTTNPFPPAFLFFHVLPGSVIPTTSSLLSTSATTCTAVWLTTWPPIRWMEGVRRREQVRAASIRISLCSLFRKWSAQWRTNWVRECPGARKKKVWIHWWTVGFGIATTS